MSGPNVSGRRYREESKEGLVFFDDVASTEPRKRERRPVTAPEPLKRVRVLAPFQVVHETRPYTGGDVVEVPESIADSWLLNKWVEILSP